MNKSGTIQRSVYEAELIKKPRRYHKCCSCLKDNYSKPLVQIKVRWYTETSTLKRISIYRICIPCARGMNNARVVLALNKLDDIVKMEVTKCLNRKRTATKKNRER